MPSIRSLLLFAVVFFRQGNFTRLRETVAPPYAAGRCADIPLYAAEMFADIPLYAAEIFANVPPRRGGATVLKRD